MSRDTKVIVGVLIVALLCSSIPIITPLAFGIGVQSGAWSDQLIHSVVFLVFTKLSALYLMVSITGFGLSQYFRNRNPRKFRLTSICFAILFLGTTLTSMLSAWVQVYYVQAEAPTTQIGMAYASVNCVSAFTNIIVWTIILIIIFSKKINPMDEVVSTQN